MPPAPLRTLLALALPMVLARATQSVITFADAIQVEHLGPGALAATATGGLNVLMVTILPTGAVFIIQSFVAQLAGRGEREATPRFAWYGLGLAAIAGVLGVAAIPAIAPALALTGYSPGVRDQMTDYMAIRMLSVAAVVGVETLGNWYGGLGNTWMQMVAGIISMVVAIACNWLLIDGHLGAPALGVDGAAIGSVVASWAGFAFLAVAFLTRRGGAPRGDGSPLTRREFGRVLRFGLPNGVNWFLEFAAFQLFVNGVLASLGDEAVAALNVVIAVNSISFMPAFGLASAGAILVGNAIGRNARDAVPAQVRRTLACTIAWQAATAVVYLAAPERILMLFDSRGHSPHLVAIGASMLAISAAWQVFDATAMTLAESLRAAGDTAWTATARLVLAWLVFTPAAFLAVDYWGGGPNAAMACLVGYLALLAVTLAWRFRTGAWRRIELIEPKLV